MDDDFDFTDAFDWVCVCLHGDVDEVNGIDSVVGPFGDYDDAVEYGNTNFSYFTVVELTGVET